MIDNLEQVEWLVTKMRQHLPLAATMTPQLARIVHDEEPDTASSAQCLVTGVDYSGDPGGIMCRLDCKTSNNSAFVVSITHLMFDRRQPAAREIAAYQKHRTKRIRRAASIGDAWGFA
jgi:hypothetical protein